MKPNLLIIVVDSLRQDKCIGDTKSSHTPNLDEFINKGSFFSQAISTASKTVPSLSSIFTGKYPFESTIVEKDFFKLDPKISTFCDELKNNGYTCNAILPEILKETNLPKLFLNVDYFNSFSTLYDENLGNNILEKLSKSMPSPWFLFIHLVDLHGNALFHLDENPDVKKQNLSGKNQYEKMLSAMDVWFGKIFEKIDTTETLCILTADHGSNSADFTNEMLDFSLLTDSIREFTPGTTFKLAKSLSAKFPKQLTPLRKELSKFYLKNKDKKTIKKLEPRINLIDELKITDYQKRLLKKSTLFPTDCFDENFRPALIFSGLTIPSKKIISNQVKMMDIFPTIFEILDINTNIEHRGHSLVPLFSNNHYNIDDFVMVDGVSSKIQKDYSDSIGLRNENYKYFRDRLDEKKNIHLYDLKNDPLELENIYENNLKIISEMEIHLESISAKKDFTFKKIKNTSQDEIDKAKKLLKDLGYV